MFSVWVFCCHMWALDELQNIPNFARIMSKMICWARRYAERIWGEFFILVRRILGKLPANLSANLDGEF